ncbi:hypothetical protein FQN54_009517 [Arachnomyces sp. PD_36]|nr:hypothetical protein FQN54_009517 [Arachnomyces sp. PD_36]
MRVRGNLFSLPVGVLALLADVVFAALPYNPSQVFVSRSEDSPLVYVLTPDPSASNQFQLFSFDTSATLTTSSPQYITLAESLPFLEQGQSKAFTPAVDAEGVLTFYTGDCADETGAGEIWYYTPTEDGESGDGTWTQASVEFGDEKEGQKVLKGNYLAPGIVFPGTSGSSPSSLYIIGGMCPESTEDEEDWVSGANYSDSLLLLEPGQSSSEKLYTLGVAESSDPPVPEAGFTLTPLLPTYSNPSTGDTVQQQNYVLIGGHTQKAFVGTSRVALFSLPETTFSFLPVNQPDGGPKSDLARKEVTEVQPRSGHTAVLSPDGSKIVVFGGWVGDTSVPAEPQLAILEVGEEYGGSGDWTWTVPEQLDSEGGLEEGSGIFGHGAAILPGDIMLVVGGYNIPSSSSKRATSEPSLSTGSLMFNISSNQWVTSYTSPERTDPEKPAPSDTEPESSGPLSSSSQKAGLGAGVGIGVSAVLLLVVYLFYSRRNRSHQKEREQALRDLALGAERPHFGGPQEMTSEFGGAATLFRPQGSNSSVPESPYAWIGNGASDAERTGLLVEVPSPTRGLRRNLYPRGYQPASGGWGNRGSTYIPPIDEQDEDEDDNGEGLGELAQTVAQRASKGSIASDPFLDPVSLDDQPGDKHTTLAAPVALRPTSKGSTFSPDKSERTSSNLSESSTVSKIVSSLNRSASQKSSIRHVHSPTHSVDRPVVTPEGHRQHQRYTGNDGKPYADSFSTAHSSFPQLQAEGEFLLGSGPEWSTPPESPAKVTSSSPPRNKALGWVRKAIASRKTGDNAERSHSVSPENATSSDQRSAASSPTKSNPFDDYNQAPLSRSVSTNTAALRRKQGAKDWGAEKRLSGASSLGNWEHGAGSVGARSVGGFSSHGDDGDDEEEWDVEAAAEGRLVQVTYTVPKEKLRVVNAGDGSDEENEDAKGKSSATNERGTSTM